MKKRLASIAVGVTFIGAALTGCSTGGGDDSSDVVIGYSAYTLSNPFFAGMIEGLETGAEERGYTVVTANANNDPAQQVTDVQNLITQGVDYIVLTPADGKAIAPAIASADAAGIPVIAVGDSVEPKITSTITPDNTIVGEQAGDAVVAFLTEKYGEPVGKVVNIEGIAGAPAALERSTGFKNVLAEYPGIEIVATADGGFDTQKSNTVMSDILQAHSDLDAVFAANDSSAMGVSAALVSAGLGSPAGAEGHVYVIGADGAKIMLDAIRSGVVDATISQNPIAMMGQAVDLIEALEKGESVDAAYTFPALLIDTENIESDAVKEYGLWADQVGE